MKTVINLSIGGNAFTIDEDACRKLENYLGEFKSKTGSGSQSGEIMDEVEQRIAELFSESISNSRHNVVSTAMVDDVIARIGFPDGSIPEEADHSTENTDTVRRFYLDPDNLKIGGVCSGLAAYFDKDVVLFRIIFVILLFCGAGLCAYIIFWLVAPKAKTAAQRCEMRGIPATAENLGKFSTGK